MFNAEKLLGKIINETIGGSGGKSERSGNGLLDSLTSGAGLMTAIGLGVGAFEILKEQQKTGASPAAGTTMPPPAPGQSSAPPPPVPPPVGQSQASPPPPPSQGAVDDSVPKLDSEEIALRMIQVMIGAAHADGVLDDEEERAILDRLRGADLNNEEKVFLLDELHQPKTVAQLTAGITDPSTAGVMYMIAVSAVKVDTEAERAWLDSLGSALGLDRETMASIEEQGGR
jgi:uncharacterized membrane protein YebE (DUF533 family)